MKKNLLILMLSVSINICYAQQQDPNQLHETAKAFIRQGDYANAVLVLNRCLQMDPKNISISKDLALAYYFQKENNKALDVIKPTLDRDEADDQCFQIAGNIYQALDLPKECGKMYKKGIKKFPESGALYNELGELLWAQKDYSAIKQWEKGIESDPSYSKNYYNAARFYYFTTDKVWSILYGEIFINMEPLSNRAPEMKDILLEGYKKLFSDADLLQHNKNKSGFVRSYLQSMNRQTSVASAGINTETLTMIRTRFILDWANMSNSRYPYKLFEYQQQLLQAGLFDAYNEWIFGSSQSLSGFQNWTLTHSTEYSSFTNFQKGRIFKLPPRQYYHN